MNDTGARLNDTTSRKADSFALRVRLFYFDEKVIFRRGPGSKKDVFRSDGKGE